MNETIQAGRIVHKVDGSLVAPINANGISYSVPGIGYTTKTGQRRAVFGCRDALEAFRVARQYARKAGRDVSAWKLVYSD